MQAVKELLATTATICDRNTEAINLLAAHLDRLTISVNQVGNRVDQLAVSQQTTQTAVDQLAGMMVRFVENAEADRAAIRELQTEVKGIQTENQRILNFLCGQQH